MTSKTWVALSILAALNFALDFVRIVFTGYVPSRLVLALVFLLAVGAMADSAATHYATYKRERRTYGN